MTDHPARRPRRQRYTPTPRAPNPWMIIGWIVLIFVVLVILANLIVGCALVTVLSHAASAAAAAGAG